MVSGCVKKPRGANRKGERTARWGDGGRQRERGRETEGGREGSREGERESLSQSRKRCGKGSIERLRLREREREDE